MELELEPFFAILAGVLMGLGRGAGSADRFSPCGVPELIGDLALLVGQRTRRSQCISQRVVQDVDALASGPLLRQLVGVQVPGRDAAVVLAFADHFAVTKVAVYCEPRCALVLGIASRYCAGQSQVIRIVLEARDLAAWRGDVLQSSMCGVPVLRGAF